MLHVLKYVLLLSLAVSCSYEARREILLPIEQALALWKEKSCSMFSVLRAPHPCYEGLDIAYADYYHAFRIPERFDHEPTQLVNIRQLSRFWMALLCPGAYACTLIGSNPCQMLMLKGRVAFYWRHERAHCNGWPSNHPYP
jgi:hypothetical protein